MRKLNIAVSGFIFASASLPGLARRTAPQPTTPLRFVVGYFLASLRDSPPQWLSFFFALLEHGDSGNPGT